MATRYSSNDPYTLSMVDAKDIYSLAKEHAADLTGEEWIDKTDYAISVDGKVVGFPVCIEARGLIYNADAVKTVTGKDFNPDEYKTLDAFQGLLEELVAGGMAAPTGGNLTDTLTTGRSSTIFTGNGVLPMRITKHITTASG